MINKIIQNIMLFVVCVPIVTIQAQTMEDYTIEQMIESYINLPSIRFTFEDFRNEEKAKEILRVHDVWQMERNFLFYQPWQIPEILESQGAGWRKGLLYESGEYSDIYQNHLEKSYNLTVEIYEELEDALDLACKICVMKQRVNLQNCPQRCYKQGI